MKKLSKVLGIIAVVAIIGFSMITCDGSGGGDDGNKFEGYWVALNSNYRFTGDSFQYYDNLGIARSGTFTFTDTQITFIAPPGTWTGYTLNYQLSGNTLTLTGTDDRRSGTFIKQ